MLKNKFILLSILGISVSGIFSSCSDFLDTVPDNRTEINTKAKAKELLVSAYPPSSMTLMNEVMSDNVTDNGPRFSYFSKLMSDSYYWKEATEETQDSPNAMWNWTYSAIAVSNHALEFCNKNETESGISPIKGEALICRAYSHFLLAINFCQHFYKNSMDLGIPYVDTPYMSIEDVPERGTISETFRRINEDIEAALPLIEDNSYSDNVSKYHFNRKSAYAFAARFNLFYGEYDKAIEYATKALGSDPASVLRNYDDFNAISSMDEIGSAWVRTSADCNLLLISVNSYWAYEHWGYETWYRYAHNQALSEKQTYYAPGPWGKRPNLRVKLFGGNEIMLTPKLKMFFEIKDVVAKTGLPHLIITPFTTDETLLVRAEAYAMKKDYPNALKDLKIWYNSNTTNAPELTEKLIRSFYKTGGGATEYTIPALHPKFELTDDQLPFIYCVLHFRRIETVHEGQRWFDVKRYGIEIVHEFTDAPSIVLKVDDNRRAIQLPDGVISAGMQANPR